MSKDSKAPSGAETLHLPDNDSPPSYFDAMSQQPATRPPLPPRQSDARVASDARSILPDETSRAGKRTLLLIYIHGFLGNEMSFQNFPAHVHSLVSVMLADTHVIHTKIYPRYKSRKAIDFARDDFSQWLAPHESSNTDVILLGHSMGGILSAEVVLLPPDALSRGQPLRHQILGTINFDTPFLGMHPGVVWSGIGSIFRPAAEPSRTPSGLTETENSTSASSLYEVQSQSSAPQGSSYDLPRPSMSPSASGLALSPGYDPNYNPPFPNDLHTPERTGWNSVIHFVTKHSDGLTRATKQYVVSHLEFGGCLADYKGLQTRYSRIRALEDVRPAEQSSSRSLRRVRFVNYYTASSGRPKKAKSPQPSLQDADRDVQQQDSIGDIQEKAQDMSLSGKGEPSQSYEKERELDDDQTIVDGDNRIEDAEPADDVFESHSHEQEREQEQGLAHLDPTPVDEDGEEFPQIEDDSLKPTETISEKEPSIADSLPPVLPLPQEPEPFDASAYTDNDVLRVAEKAHKRVVKAYTQAIKDREKSIRDREKLASKRERDAKRAQEKRQKGEEKSVKEKEKAERKEVERQQRAEEKEQQQEQQRQQQQQRLAEPDAESSLQAQRSRSQTASARNEGEALSPSSSNPNPNVKPKRDKKFCITPSKSNGNRDPTWIRVYMEGVDEVGAHCGLFFPSETYEKLVGDVASRIEEWVREGAV